MDEDDLNNGSTDNEEKSINTSEDEEDELNGDESLDSDYEKLIDEEQMMEDLENELLESDFSLDDWIDINGSFVLSVE